MSGPSRCYLLWPSSSQCSLKSLVPTHCLKDFCSEAQPSCALEATRREKSKNGPDGLRALRRSVVWPELELPREAGEAGPGRRGGPPAAQPALLRSRLFCGQFWAFGFLSEVILHRLNSFVSTKFHCKFQTCCCEICVLCCLSSHEL